MRIIIALITALAVSLLSGPFVIAKLRSMKFGQQVREEGLEEHYKKQGTPTMGGFIFIVGILVSVFITNGFITESLMITLGMLLFGAVGFLDDYIKIRKERSEGLTPIQKIGMTTVFSLIMGLILLWYFNGGQGLHLNVQGRFFHLNPFFYLIFVVIFYTAAANSVNLADGVDGLCGSVTGVVAVFYIIFLLTKGAFIQQSYSMAAYAAALLGGLGGYLYYNWHPAKVFMGDTGSFALGGLLATLAILTNTEILFILIGLIYVIEALSVIIQVTYFKRTGKRIFKMAPIHHHYEKEGWNEKKIVAVFSAFTAVTCLLALLIIR